MKKRIPLFVLATTVMSLVFFLSGASPVSAASVPKGASPSGHLSSYSMSTLPGTSSVSTANVAVTASSCSGTSSTQRICKIKLSASPRTSSAYAVFCPGALILITNQGYSWCIWGVDGNFILGVTNIINANPISGYGVYLNRWGFILVPPLGFMINIGGQTAEYVMEVPVP